jgi:hypothetical protein
MAIRLAIALLGILASAQAQALDVKGLRLGEVYTPQKLAEIFGSARCAKLGFGATYNCPVPISYLGLKTDAEVVLSENWVAREIAIKIPRTRIKDVESVLLKQYGIPHKKRGEPDGWAPPVHPGEQKQQMLSRCTEWRNVEGGNVSVCEPLFPTAGGPYVRYSISDNIELDPADI